MKTTILKSYFSSKVRAKTWKKLATLLRHNIGELHALTTLQARYAAQNDPLANLLFGGHPLAVVFGQVIDEIKKGQPLDVALYAWVPHEEIMLIRGGKNSARLVEALLDCVKLIEAKQKITSSIIKAVAYPMMLLSLFVVLLLVVSLHVVPELSLLSNPELWDGAAGALYTVSSFVSSLAGIIVFVALFALLVVILGTLPFWTGRLRIMFDNAPPWSIYRLMNGSVWLFTVATLLRANNSLDFILKDMLDSGVLRPWLRERVQRIRNNYQKDANFGKLLVSLNMNFPDKELVEDLAVYASMPDFHRNMYDIAREWLDEGVERIATQSQLVNSGFLIGILAVLCGLGVAIGSMQEQLNNTMGVM